MTLVAYLNGSDVAHKVRLNAFGLTSRADSTYGAGGIVFDDEDADMTVRGWMSLRVEETDCVSAPILFSGFVADRIYGRSGEATKRVGADRWVDTTAIDQNAVMHIRLITEADGKRDAETHIERIDWLLGSAYLSGLIDGDGFVDRSFPRPFDEADYRGQYADDVLQDIAGPIFRTFFVYLDGATGDRILFFDTPTSTVGTSDLTISNVLSDNDSTCFPPFIDATMTRTPEDVYAEIRYTSARATVIEKNAATKIAFFDDNGLGYRGLDVQNSRVGDEASARTMADNLLAQDSTENDTIQVTIEVPAASAGLLRAGQRVGVRFTHLPGYETLTYTRVTALTIRQAPGTNKRYLLELELNNHGLSSVGGGGAPPPDDFPHPPQPGQLHEWSGQFTVVPTPFHSYGWSKGSSDLTLPDGNENHTVSTTNPDSMTLIDSDGYTFGCTVDPVIFGQFGLQSPGSPSHVVQVGNADAVAGWHFNAPSGSDTVVYAYGSLLSDAPATYDWWLDSDTWVPIPPVPPTPGQEVPWTVVSMSPSGGVSVGTAPFPYANLSLKVKVDGVLISPASYVETDPATGDFALTWLLDGDETVTVSFQGR